MGKYPHVRLTNEPVSFVLMQSTPTQLKRDPCCYLKGDFILLLHGTRISVNTNYSTRTRWQPGHDGVPIQKGVSLLGIPIPSL